MRRGIQILQGIAGALGGMTQWIFQGEPQPLHARTQAIKILELPPQRLLQAHHLLGPEVR